MKIIKKTIHFLLIFTLLFISSCDLYKTYSEDEYMKIGQTSNHKQKNRIITKDLCIKQTLTNSTINDDGSFSFDMVQAANRNDAITFELFNNGNTDLILTGDPKIQVGSSDFEAVCSSLPGTIAVGDSAEFTLRYVSTVTDGLKKSTLVDIPNSHNNNFIFSISCTAKVKIDVEYTSPGTHHWTCSVNNISASVILVGGGGGGGGGSNGPNGGGGGGGAGEEKQINYIFNNRTYTVIIGDGGREGDDNEDSSPGDSGRNGEGTTILNGSTSLIYADYGRGGAGGILNGGNAAGGTGGNSDLSLRGENSQSGDGDGGRGGDNGRGHGGRGNGRSGANDGDKGGDAPSNSGGGGGGGGAAVTDPSKHGEDGGHGGSGYCRIQWTGFAIH